MNIKNRIIAIMKSSFSDNKIDEKSNSDNTENWDSINFLLLIVKLESEFNIKFQPDEISEMTDYTKIEKYVKSKI